MSDSLPELESAKHQVEPLRAQLRGLQDELDKARDQVRAGSVGREEADARHAAEVARLEEERRADQARLLQGRRESDRIAVELGAAKEAALRAERDRAALARERDEALTDRARLEEQVAGLRAEVEGAARHAEPDARALEAEQARADEAERLATSLQGKLDAALPRAAEEINRLKTEHETAYARLTAEASASCSERDGHADECARLRARCDELVRERDEARRRSEEESLRAAELAGKAEHDVRDLETAHAFRADLDRIERERQAERDGHERDVLAIRRDLEDALAQAEAERARAAALTEATTDLERRLAESLDDLNAMTALAESAEALRERSAARNGGAPTLADVAGVDDQPARSEELLRQLQDARQANQRLSALLGVFGMPRADTPQLPARIGPSPESSARKASSPTLRP